MGGGEGGGLGEDGVVVGIGGEAEGLPQLGEIEGHRGDLGGLRRSGVVLQVRRHQAQPGAQGGQDIEGGGVGQPGQQQVEHGAAGGVVADHRGQVGVLALGEHVAGLGQPVDLGGKAGAGDIGQAGGVDPAGGGQGVSGGLGVFVVDHELCFAAPDTADQPRGDVGI